MASSLSLSRLITPSAISLSSTTKPSLSLLRPTLLSLSSKLPSKSLSLSSPTTTILRRARTISATISVGDTLPDATLSYFPPSSDDLQTTTISSLTKSKKAILFAVPGAFTPTCSQKHLPGFIAKAGELKAKGVEVIACVSVNDAFVMKAWGESLGLKDGGDVMLLSDGNMEFTKAIGCEMDLSDKPVGLGKRSRRYAMLVEDGVVKVLNLEEGGAFTNSSAEDMLNAL